MTRAVTLAEIAAEEVLTVDGTNSRIGIGTTQPTTKLDVDGTISASDGMVVTGITTYQGDISIADKIIHTGDTNTAIRFPADDTVTIETVGSERVRVSSDGNVGIGTDNPTKKLTVYGSDTELVRFTQAVDSGTQQEFGIGFAANPNHTHPAAQITYEEFDASDSRGNLLFYTRGDNSDSAPVERMRITSSGNFGIGTNNPGSALHINSSTPTVRVQDSDGTNQYSQFFQASTSTYIENRNDTGAGAIIFRQFDGSVQQEKMRINADGDVGIGTNNPTEKLHVLGDARITGILTVGTASVTIDGDAGTITGTTFTGTATTATNLSDAANITTGTLADARIPDLSASKITSGAFADARIPNLNASKITAGTFGTGRIPNLNANKITSGTLNVNITTSRVTDEIATSTAGTKGSYAFLGQTTNTARSPNYTVAGSSLLYANANGPESGSPGGSWRLMGRLGSGEDPEKASVWVRYA